MHRMKTRTLYLAAPLAAAALLAAATLPGSASSAAGEPGAITVRGTASIVSVPDRAELSFGVETQASTARAALAANAAEMRKVIAAVRSGGGTDVRTQSVSLAPRYGERNEVQSFAATNTISVEIKGIAGAGALIDAAVAAGANQVYGPSPAVGDETEQYRQALKRAVEDARASAQALAAAAGLSLGRVTAIIESGAAPAPQPYAATADKATALEATPIEPGTQQTSASVTVTYSVA